MRIIGIDIGSYSIKIAEVESSVKGITLKDFQEIELNHELGKDERFEKLEKLKNIVAQYDLQQTKFVVGLGSEYISARLIDFPFIEKRKILQSLPFELEDNIPFSQDDAIFDFRIVSQTQTHSQVLAVAAPKKHIKDALDLLEDAGVDPEIISVDSIARSNLYEAPQLNIENQNDFAVSDIFIHIGYKKTLVNITKNGNLYASRAIFFGGFDLASSVSRAYEIPFLEALKNVKENGFILTSPVGADEDQIAFSQIMAQAFSILINEVKRTIIDLKADQNLNFSNAYISGGLSNFINLTAYLTQEIGIEFNIQHSLPANLNSEIVMAPASEKVAGVAIGLAIEGTRKPQYPAINLRRNEFVKQNQGLKILYERHKSLILSSAFALCLFFAFSFVRSMLTQDNLDTIDQVISDQAKTNTIGLTKAQTKPDALKKFVKTKQQELESKKEVLKFTQMSSALDVLKSISSGVPSKDQIKLDITFFKIDREKITIEGMTHTQEEFNLFQRKLNQIPQISQLKLGPAPKADTGRYFFQVSMNYKRNKNRDIK
jgi:general secretion pathway protein L